MRLRGRVRVCLKLHAITPRHVCYAGEDEPAWVGNFLAALGATGSLVLRVNARDAKDLRESNIASTDDLDLLGIAKCLLSRKARLINAATMQENESARRVRSLRDLMRQRRRLVHRQTAAQNQTHCLVDRLSPGFMNDLKTVINRFGAGSLALMSERFSAQEISRRRLASIAASLHRCIAASLHRCIAASLQRCSATASAATRRRRRRSRRRSKSKPSPKPRWRLPLRRSLPCSAACRAASSWCAVSVR